VVASVQSSWLVSPAESVVVCAVSRRGWCHRRSLWWFVPSEVAGSLLLVVSFSRW
jgi:hypothetical protein